MPTEAQFTYRLTAELRKRLPDAVIVKLADRFTAGLPDFFISCAGSVTWFEVKLTTNREAFRPIQLQMLLKLRRGAYVIWNSETKMGQVFWAVDYNDFTHHRGYNAHMWHNFQDLIQRVIALESEEI